MKNYTKGFLITLIGVLVLSPDSLLIRLAGQDVFTIIFYRGVFLAFWLGLILALIYKKNFFSTIIRFDKLDFLLAICYAIGAFSFVFAISHTTIAKAILIVSVSPIISAIFSYFFLSEKITISTMWAMIFALLGFVVIFYEKNLGAGSWFGNINAFISAVVLSSIFIISRYKKKSMMVPLFYSGIFVAIISLLFFHPMFQISFNSLLILWILGLIIAVSFALLTLGPKYVSATEVNLIMLLETILSIFLAWWILKETPSIQTTIGGVMVISTLVFHSLWQIKKAH